MPMAWLTLAHLAGVLLWIGGLLAVARLTSLHAAAPTAPAIGARLTAIGRGLYWRFAAPGAFATIVTGVVLLNADRDLLKQPFMQAKLGVVILLIGCDHLCMRALKRSATGGGTERRGGWLPWVVLLLAVGALACIIVRPWERA